MTLIAVMISSSSSSPAPTPTSIQLSGNHCNKPHPYNGSKPLFQIPISAKNDNLSQRSSRFPPIAAGNNLRVPLDRKFALGLLWDRGMKGKVE